MFTERNNNKCNSFGLWGTNNPSLLFEPMELIYHIFGVYLVHDTFKIEFCSCRTLFLVCITHGVNSLGCTMLMIHQDV